MLILEFYPMVKKKTEGSGRSSKAKGNVKGDKPEEPQGRQDRERHPEADNRDVNLPRNSEEMRTEARDQSNRPRSEPYDSRHRSRHRRGSESVRPKLSRSRHRLRRRSARPWRRDKSREGRIPVSRSYYREREDPRRGRSRFKSRQENPRRGRSWSRSRQVINPFSEDRYYHERRRGRTRSRERSRDLPDSQTARSVGFDRAMEALANNAEAGSSGIFRSIVDGKSDGLRQETLN